MYSPIPMNSNSLMPGIPPPQFCAPPMYGNVPFPQPFPIPQFYPPTCTPYKNPNATGNFINSSGGGPQFPNFASNKPASFLSQPPPGYRHDGQPIPQSAFHCNPVPPYQPVHMANICSTSFSNFPAQNNVPTNNQFNYPPPTVPYLSNSSQNNAKSFSHFKNNRNVTNAKDSPYFCETCDRGFPSLSKFTEHKNQHVTCEQEGCTFTGHPKIVEKHFLMQHRTGLFSRIVKGNSPEEIQKWISERKKHFPTKDKIEVKQAQREEMEKRGERYADGKKTLNNKRNSYSKSHPNNRFNKNPANRNSQYKTKSFGLRRNFSTNKVTNEKSSFESRRKEPINDENEDIVLRNVPPFKGTAHYISAENDLSIKGTAIFDDDTFSITSTEDNGLNSSEDHENTTINENITEPGSSITTPIIVNEFQKSGIEENNSNIHVEVCNVSDENIEKIDPSRVDDGSKMLNDVNSLDESLKNKQELNASGSLALIQCYDSDSASDENDNDFIEGKNAKNVNIPLEVAEIQQNTINSEDDGPEECSSKCEPKTEITVSSVNDCDKEKNDDSDCNDRRKRKRKRRKDEKSENENEAGTEEKPVAEKLSQIIQPRKRYRPPTLLEKLLDQEIKHERNVILQCVRYVVENNFFDVGSSDQPR